MKQITLLLCVMLLALTVAGCDSNNGSNGPMPQGPKPAAQDGGQTPPADDAQPPAEPPAGQEAAPEQSQTPQQPETQDQAPAAQGTAEPDVTALLAQYYALEAEEEALDIEEDKLAAQYRIGDIDEETFRAKEREREQREDAVDWDKDDVAWQLRQAGWRDDAPYREAAGDTVKTLRTLLKEQKKLEDEVEREARQLARQYRNDEITREDYLTQQTALEQRQDEIDREEDQLEWELERLGWDD